MSPEPMRYWLLRERKPEGPYTARELVCQPDFDPGLMICPEDCSPGERSSWRPARKAPEVLEAMRRGTALAPPGAPAAVPAAGGNKHLPLLAILAAVLLAVLGALAAYSLF